MKLRSATVALGITLSILLSIIVEVKPTHSKVAQLTNSETSTPELETVKNSADLIRLNGQRVKLIGRYISKSWKPNPALTGIPDFPGLYIKSQIVLEDGTEVSIFPSWHKQSLRSPEEAEQYNNHIVKAIGVVQFAATPTPNSPTRESFIDLEQLKLYTK